MERLVWIVDDSPTDSERARRSLGDLCEVRLFHDGSAVLEALVTQPPPDVLVLDWVMPGVSGIEVCRFLRASESNRNVSVLLLTSQNATDQIVEGLAAGANDYISKPYAPEELRARVENQIRAQALLERAERAEATVTQLLENTPDALFVTDASGAIEFVNVAATELLGMPAASMLGRSLYELMPGYDGTPAEVKQGSGIWAPTVRRIPGEAQRASISFRNVTERRAEEQRRLDFYSMVAHDLRSPLFAILMRTEVILKGKRGNLSAELTADIQKIHRGIRELVAMVSDFLDVARFENKGGAGRRDPIKLDSLVRSAIEDFSPLAEASKITLQVADLPESGAPVGGDPHRLTQVMNNLVANAIKFTGAGGSVEVSIVERDQRWRVSVRDTGRGIPAELLPQLFQRYVRAIDPMHEVAGTGLGLMIVRQIVEQHGGEVGVESTQGSGSTFWFELPRVEAETAGDVTRAS